MGGQHLWAFAFSGSLLCLIVFSYWFCLVYWLIIDCVLLSLFLTLNKISSSSSSHNHDVPRVQCLNSTGMRTGTPFRHLYLAFHHLKLVFLYCQKDLSSLTYRFTTNHQCMGVLRLCHSLWYWCSTVILANVELVSPPTGRVPTRTNKSSNFIYKIKKTNKKLTTKNEHDSTCYSTAPIPMEVFPWV